MESGLKGQDAYEVSATDFGHEAASALSNAISIVTPQEGTLAETSTITVELQFAPTAVGPAQAILEMLFLDQDVPPVRVQVTAECTNLPVQLEHTVSNFLTCQFGRIYSDTLVVLNNHANSAVKVQFELPAECQPYFSFSPRNAFLPAKVSAHI